MAVNRKLCVVTEMPEGVRCTRRARPGTDYCWEHEHHPMPTDEDRLVILKMLAAPRVWSLSPEEIHERIAGKRPHDGRTRERRQWFLRTMTLRIAEMELEHEGLIYQAVPADGYHWYEVRLTDVGREFLALTQTAG